MGLGPIQRIAGLLSLTKGQTLDIPKTHDLDDDTRFTEFYNLVFMEFYKNEDCSIEQLKEKNIDTGIGLERMARILQKVPNNYETDLIFPIVEEVAELAKVSYADVDDYTKTKLKVIGDHMRVIVYLISDGVLPSPVLRGYVAKLDDALENERLYNTDARLSGKDAFHLYSTYGYPIEMTIEGAHERGVSIDVTEFNIEKDNHKNKSKLTSSTRDK
ncbi:alanine--tRNA ligase, chloroplastic/mitochondrial [Tanacetum coccineum]